MRKKWHPGSQTWQKGSYMLLLLGIPPKLIFRCRDLHFTQVIGGLVSFAVTLRDLIRAMGETKDGE